MLKQHWTRVRPLPLRLLLLSGLPALVTACHKDPEAYSPSTGQPGIADPSIQCQSADPLFYPGYLDPPYSCGALAQPGEEWIGGGNGYPRIVPESAATIVVSTSSELIDALTNAQAGDVVFLSSNGSFDMTGLPTLDITVPMVLASDRGHSGSPGAKLFDADPHLGDGDIPGVKSWILHITSPEVRVTGLRIEGPHPTDGDQFRSVGIRFRSLHGGEVDNCDISGFGSSGIALSTASAIWIHNNYIHHNEAEHLGYGISLNGNGGLTTARIEANSFALNRHAVTATGHETESYYAVYNIIWSYAAVPGRRGFDVHCFDKDPITDDPLPPYTSGDRIVIVNNTVLDVSGPAIRCSGNPTTGLWILNNKFAHESMTVVSQPPYPALDTAALEGHPGAEGTPDVIAGLNCFGTTSHGLFVSHSGTWPWQPYMQTNYNISDLHFAKFDGDERTDAFRPDGTQWNLASGAVGGWLPLLGSGTSLSTLGFGDFDGDGRTDVLHPSGGEWLVSYSGLSNWSVLHTSNVALENLGIGDFDGDGKADILHPSGGQWLVSYGGTTSWQVLGTSGVLVDAMAFADFDGDGKTDIFHPYDGQWLVSYGGTSPWNVLRDAPQGLDDLAFGDFNGDGKADAFRTNGSAWYVSWGATSAWEQLGTSGATLNELGFGDFNGDGRCDVIDWQ